MRKVITIAALVILVIGSSSIVPSSSYAADKIGLGIDFYRDIVRSNDNDYDQDKETNGIRLYYEHLLEQTVGIQVELGFSHYDDNYNQGSSSEYVYDKDRADLVGLLKYYFPLKGKTSVYIGGGVGLTYLKAKRDVNSYNQERETWVDLCEQAAVGVQFPLTENLNAFIEDRFISKISDGYLRVGLYINL